MAVRPVTLVLLGLAALGVGLVVRHELGARKLAATPPPEPEPGPSPRPGVQIVTPAGGGVTHAESLAGDSGGGGVADAVSLLTALGQGGQAGLPWVQLTLGGLRTTPAGFNGVLAALEDYITVRALQSGTSSTAMLRTAGTTEPAAMDTFRAASRDGKAFLMHRDAIEQLRARKRPDYMLIDVVAPGDVAEWRGRFDPKNDSVLVQRA